MAAFHLGVPLLPWGKCIDQQRGQPEVKSATVTQCQRKSLFLLTWATHTHNTHIFFYHDFVDFQMRSGHGTWKSWSSLVIGDHYQSGQPFCGLTCAYGTCNSHKGQWGEFQCQVFVHVMVDKLLYVLHSVKVQCGRERLQNSCLEESVVLCECVMVATSLPRSHTHTRTRIGGKLCHANLT